MLSHDTRLQGKCRTAGLVRKNGDLEGFPCRYKVRNEVRMPNLLSDYQMALPQQNVISTRHDGEIFYV